MAIPFEDKRNYPRIKLSIPLRYQIRGSPESGNTLSNDIGLNGIGFTDNKFIAPNVPVSIEIKLLSCILRPAGRIAWSSPLAHSDRYRSGIEFSEFNPKEKTFLKDYLDMQMGKL